MGNQWVGVRRRVTTLDVRGRLSRTGCSTQAGSSQRVDAAACLMGRTAASLPWPPATPRAQRSAARAPSSPSPRRGTCSRRSCTPPRGSGRSRRQSPGLGRGGVRVGWKGRTNLVILKGDKEVPGPAAPPPAAAPALAHQQQQQQRRRRRRRRGRGTSPLRSWSATSANTLNSSVALLSRKASSRLPSAASLAAATASAVSSSWYAGWTCDRCGDRSERGGKGLVAPTKEKQADGVLMQGVTGA